MSLSQLLCRKTTRLWSSGQEGRGMAVWRKDDNYYDDTVRLLVMICTCIAVLILLGASVAPSDEWHQERMGKTDLVEIFALAVCCIR